MINCFYSIVVCANYKKVQIIGLKNGEKVQVIKFCKLCSSIGHFKNFIFYFVLKLHPNKNPQIKNLSVFSQYKNIPNIKRFARFFTIFCIYYGGGASLPHPLFDIDFGSLVIVLCRTETPNSKFNSELTQDFVLSN